uniref:Methyltransferase domain-containing protein n=1 Tax=Aplanochytrium stocchinoi TaxID=215587 RepID=A0A7S3PHB6_9STRA|mmetsp:Transcript_17573/g.21627  ORF Transcript_17573/g.21627 Transcript_17573/m.21627 type:complete len:263 (+) Transcript_17573:76-864(+)|eukprot:CAMPEP_0204838190 /NCGR_PEP_ID=MMETSP1346-20131115/30135_1 /ASSEMBLY_ACC=CAM_ASM_000771 /TAXON_ID=215587 /ORGANISM="Aplanochytrium stocchinoi, Strain GSBS06" /LENGTH=262 /DNA_ID=CAMNT_0051974075 /DNA_START=112 /DNA_END=900 /DNA_ORIENTATION=-
MELPAISETAVTLAHPHATCTDSTKAYTPTEIYLVHIADPKKSTFSQRKKQCDLWEYVWGSSVLLGGLLSMVDMSGLSVLEIGGGQGLCSIAAAKSGASVLMTDLVLDATKLAQMSAEKNGVSERIRFRSLNWDKLDTVPNEEFDVVIGSDVLFFRGTVSPVATTIHKALKPGGIALVADPCRLNVEDFASKIEELGLNVELLLFKDELLHNPKQHAVGDTAFVDIKRAKLVVIRKPGDRANSSIENFDKILKSLLPQFTKA